MQYYAKILCNTISDKGQNTCWKMFIKYAHLLTGVARVVYIDDALAFVRFVYGIGEKYVLMMPGIIVLWKRNVT